MLNVRCGPAALLANMKDALEDSGHGASVQKRVPGSRVKTRVNHQLTDAPRINVLTTRPARLLADAKATLNQQLLRVCAGERALLQAIFGTAIIACLSLLKSSTLPRAPEPGYWMSANGGGR